MSAIDGYRQCDSLEEVASAALQAIPAGSEWVANFDLKVLVPIEAFAEPALMDAAEKAEAFQSVVRPPELFFTHGEFIGPDGLDHICRELREKPDSNRALASLISQKHIIGSGDSPLPSFLVVQGMMDGTTLYLTTMYRALEVSTFLRINIEEMRLIGKKIYDSNRNITQVALCIFATRAYVKEGMNTLAKSEIDRISVVDMMSSQKSRIPWLLRDKARQSTYPETIGLEHLLSIAKGEMLPQESRLPGHGPLLVARIESALASLVNLGQLRRESSHHADIFKLEKKLADELNAIADLMEASR